MKISHLLIAASATLLASCSQETHWNVSGNITGADGQLLTLERSYNGRWNVVDSVRLSDKGDYSLKAVPAGYPDIYRVALDGRPAYFPIDSIESITLNANAANFASAYKLSGSTEAELFNSLNDNVNAALKRNQTNAASDSILKANLSEIVFDNMGSIVAYYIINKEINGKRIFNPADKKDLRIIGAVVNSFATLRPNDPRTRSLKEQYLMWRRATAEATTTVEATEIGFPEIELNDSKGNKRSLTSLVGKGKPVILNFTAYEAESSPAFNVVLAEIFNNGDAEIYQVSVDKNEYLWREAAKNIPWTAVHNSPRDGDQVLTNYNVSVIPTTFIIGRDGKLKERIADITKLHEQIKKY